MLNLMFNYIYNSRNFIIIIFFLILVAICNDSMSAVNINNDVLMKHQVERERKRERKRERERERERVGR
jgi:hypothetical protein